MTAPTEDLIERLEAETVEQDWGFDDWGRPVSQTVASPLHAEAAQALRSLHEEVERLRGENRQMQARLDRWEPRVNVEVGSYLTGVARCNKLMEGLGKPYPRTCMVCRLGPCRNDVNAYQGLVKAANAATDADIIRSALNTGSGE